MIILIGALVICACMIGCTIFIVMALANLMAAIARHNAHMDTIKINSTHIGAQMLGINATLSGLANYYKRVEDEKRVG